MDRLDQLARLRSLGLSDYQAAAYLALLSLGKTEAREVSRLSKVPIAKIYQTLQQLQERGLALSFPENPRRYAPVEMASYLARRVHEHESAIEELQAMTESAARDFVIAPAPAADDRGAIVVHRGRGAALAALRAHVSEAAGEILLLLSVGSSQGRIFAQIEPALLAAAERGVNVRVLLQNVPAASLRRDAIQRVRVRAAGELANVTIIVVDQERGLMQHAVPDDGDPQRGFDVAIDINEKGLAGGLRALLEREWERWTPRMPPFAGRANGHGVIAEHMRLMEETVAITAKSRQLAAKMRERFDSSRSGGSPPE